MPRIKPRAFRCCPITYFLTYFAVVDLILIKPPKDKWTDLT